MRQFLITSKRNVYLLFFFAGINSARTVGASGASLPNVRRVSVNIHQDVSRLNKQHTNLLMSWGQILTNDLVKGGFLSGTDNLTRIQSTLVIRISVIRIFLWRKKN